MADKAEARDYAVLNQEGVTQRTWMDKKHQFLKDPVVRAPPFPHHQTTARPNTRILAVDISTHM